MKRGFLIAGVVLAIGLIIGRAARRYSPPARISDKPSSIGGGSGGAWRSVNELEAILKSRNDNDPRLDADFNSLSGQEKEQFEILYRRQPPEKRNERGTIVYLLGKNLRDADDWAFLRGVVQEPPCLSLADCSKKGTGGEGLGDDVTLAYPALVALKSAQRVLESGKDAEAVKQARSVVEAAKTSQMPAVKRLVASIQRRRPQ